VSCESQWPPSLSYFCCTITTLSLLSFASPLLSYYILYIYTNFQSFCTFFLPHEIHLECLILLFSLIFILFVVQKGYRKMNIWMVWKPTKNACLNWCACQFAYLNLIILIMPIKLSDHSNIPTIQLFDCLTIRPFWSFWLSDFLTIQLSSYLTCLTITTVQLSNHSDFLTVQLFQLPNQSDFSPILPFQLSDHLTFPTVQPFWLSHFLTIATIAILTSPTFHPFCHFDFLPIQPFQLSNHFNCSTIPTFQPFWLSNYSTIWQFWIT
jgi:hypothetical protein